MSYQIINYESGELEEVTEEVYEARQRMKRLDHLPDLGQVMIYGTTSHSFEDNDLFYDLWSSSFD